MNEVDVTIIVVAYNNEKYIRRALNSAVNQKGANPDILIVYDTHSKDNTGSICEEYANKYRKVEMLRVPKCWVGRARNLGAAYAKTRYIKFLDGDDVLPEHSIATLLDNSEGKDLVFGDSTVVFPGGKRRYCSGKGHMIGDNMSMGLNCTMFDRYLYLEHLYCPEYIRSAEDHRENYLAPIFCKDRKYIEENVYDCHVNPGSNTNGDAKNMVSLSRDSFEFLREMNTYEKLYTPENWKAVQTDIMGPLIINLIHINKLETTEEKVLESMFWIYSMNLLIPNWREHSEIKRLSKKPIFNKLLKFYVDDDISTEYVKFSNSLRMKLIILIQNISRRGGFINYLRYRKMEKSQ